MKTKQKYFFYFLLGAITLVSIAIVWPFITVIIIGASLATVFYPVYNRLQKIFRGVSWISALATIILFLVVLCVPLYFATVQVIHDASSFSLTDFSESLKYAIPENPLFDIESAINQFVSLLTGSLSKIFASTVQSVFSSFLIILSVFYFLKDSSYWRKMIIDFSPLPDDQDDKILSMFAKAVGAVFEGYILIAILQGLLMGVGLALFGVPSPALWGMVAGFASLIPSVGTAIISIPAILYLFVVGDNGSAVGLGIWAGVLVGLVDNVLNPFIVGRNLKLPPVVMLFSVIGGVALLGPSGIIIGPLALSLTHTLFKIYKEDYE